MITDDFFIPETDITETLADGRVILVEPAGIPIPLHLARERGYLKDHQRAGPSETKGEATEATEATEAASNVSVRINDKRSKAERK